MDRFHECLAFVLKAEGGYVDDPVDRGGATNHGITQRNYDAWCLAKFMPTSSVRDILPDEVEAIYRASYWEPVRAHLVMEPLDMVLFDTAVQHGARRAVMLLQQAIGCVDVDGKFGPTTLSAVMNRPASLLAYKVMDQRKRFYDHIIENDPTQQRFEGGWNNRMAALAQQTRLT